MGTSALSSEMSMGRRPIAKSGLFSLVPIEEVRLQGGCLFGWRRSPFPFVAVVYRNVSLSFCQGVVGNIQCLAPLTSLTSMALQGCSSIEGKWILGAAVIRACS